MDAAWKLILRCCYAFFFFFFFFFSFSIIKNKSKILNFSLAEAEEQLDEIGAEMLDYNASGRFLSVGSDDDEDDEKKMNILCWMLLGSNVITIFTLLAILLRMKLKQQLAQAGDVRKKHSVILPAYKKLLWMLVALFSIVAVTYTVTLNKFKSQWERKKKKRDAFMFFQGQSICFLGFYSIIPALLIQKTVTMKALYRVIATFMPWMVLNSYLAYGLVLGDFCDDQESGCPLDLAFAISGPLPPLIFHFLYVTGRLRSRIELRSYSAKLSTLFACIYSALLLILNLIEYLKKDGPFPLYLMEIGSSSLFAMNLIFPLAMYKSLIADTKYWRGLGKYNKKGILCSNSSDNLGCSNGEIGAVR